MVRRTSDWRVELGRWLKPFLDRLGHKARRQMCPLYVSGLIGPGDRKSIQPMARRLWVWRIRSIATIAREPGATFSAKKCRLAVLRARECEIATAQAIGGFFGSATVCGRCTGLSF